MKKLGNLLEKRWAANTFAMCSAVVLYLLLTNLSSFRGWFGSIARLFSPVLIGLVLAYLIDPLAKVFETRVFHRVKRELLHRLLSVVAALVLVLAGLTAFFVLLIPSLVESATALVNSANAGLEQLLALLDRLNSSELGTMLELGNLSADVEELLKSAVTVVTSNLTSILSRVGALGSAVFNWIIGFIMSIYFLMGKKPLLEGTDRLRRAALTDAVYSSRTAFWRRCNEIFVRYVTCSLLDAMIVGISNAIFMSIARMPYIPLVSVAVGVTNLLPSFGPMIGAAIGSFILVLYKPIVALWFLLFTIVLQTIDGYVLKPKLFSSSFGIPSVWALIAIVLGGKFFGMVGVLLSIPMAAVVSMLYHEKFLPWLRRRKEKVEAEAKVF